MTNNTEVNNTEVKESEEEKPEVFCRVCSLSNKLVRIFAQEPDYVCTFCAHIDRADALRMTSAERRMQANLSQLFHVQLNHAIATSHNMGVLGKALADKLDILIGQFNMLITTMAAVNSTEKPN